MTYLKCRYDNLCRAGSVEAAKVAHGARNGPALLCAPSQGPVEKTGGNAPTALDAFSSPPFAGNFHHGEAVLDEGAEEAPREGFPRGEVARVGKKESGRKNTLKPGAPKPLRPGVLKRPCWRVSDAGLGASLPLPGVQRFRRSRRPQHLAQSLYLVQVMMLIRERFVSCDVLAVAARSISLRLLSSRQQQNNTFLGSAHLHNNGKVSFGF